MRTSWRWFGLCSWLLWLLPGLARASDIAVFPTEISNLSPQDAESVGNLIAQSYAAVSQREVAAPSQTAAALAQSHDYTAAATQLGAKEYIRLSAVSAGHRLVITAGRYSVDGRSLMQLRQTAESIEDVALAADSIARGLYSGVPSAAPAPIAQGLPLPVPPMQVPKKRNEAILGIKTGVHMPFAKNASYYPAISLQFNGRLQLPHFFLEFGVGFLIPTTLTQDEVFVPCSGSDSLMCGERKTNRGHVGGITTELGASYYLTESNVAPYIGGGIIPRVILAGMDNGGDRQDIASMSVYAQVGLTFPRDRPTRIFVDLRLAQGILEQHLHNGNEVWPTEPSLHAGIGW